MIGYARLEKDYVEYEKEGEKDEKDDGENEEYEEESENTDASGSDFWALFINVGSFQLKGFFQPKHHHCDLKLISLAAL